jgi:RNA polymerase I-specific transcription initiation factor RRN3
LYREWSDVAITNDDDSDEDESDEEEGEEKESEVESSLADSLLGDDSKARRVPTSFKGGSWSERRRKMFDRDGGLSSSLEGMSISPGISRMVGVSR